MPLRSRRRPTFDALVGSADVVGGGLRLADHGAADVRCCIGAVDAHVVRAMTAAGALAKRMWLLDSATMEFASPLPIDAILDEARNALAASASDVFVAPPGAGNTTRIPFALLNEAGFRTVRSWY